MMNAQVPQWKQKTRPCPFYSQGRCLFADSCNFLHTAKVQRPDGALISTAEYTPISPPESPVPGSRSAMPPKFVRFRSPPRSPRLSSLLLALGDVIQLDDEEVVEEVEAELQAEEQLAAGVDVAERESPDVQDDALLASSLERMYQLEDATLAYHSDLYDDTESITQTTSTAAGSPFASSSFDPPFTIQSHHVSPDDSSDLDSQGDVTVTQSLPLPSGLLSPIEITSASLPHARTSMDLHRGDSFDSGYAEGVYSSAASPSLIPATFLTSPPRSPRRVSTLSILSSPFGSPTTRMRHVQGHESNGSGVAELFSPTFKDVDARSARYSDVSDDPHSSDIVHAQEEAAVADEGFDESFMSSLSSPVITDEEGHILSVDSPLVPVETEIPSSASADTMQTLYDGYMDGEEDTVLALPSPYESGSGSVSRPPVFSPPSPRVWTGEDPRGRSLGLAYEDVESDSAPCVFSLSRMDKGKSSIPLNQDVPRQSATRDSSRESHSQSHSREKAREKERAWEKRASTKVPLAWRQSVTAPQQLARTASMSGRTPGTVRPRPPALVGLNPPTHDRSRDSSRERNQSQPKELHLLSPEEGKPPLISRGLRPLRLSVILTSSSRDPSPSSIPTSSSFSSFSVATPASSLPPPLTADTSAFPRSPDSSDHVYTPAYASTPASPTVSSEYSLSHNRLLSSRPSTFTSNYIPASRNTLPTNSKNNFNSNIRNPDQHANAHAAPLHTDFSTSREDTAPRSAPVSRPSSTYWASHAHARRGSSRFSSVASRRLSQIDRYARPDSRLSEPGILYEDDEDRLSSQDDHADWADDTIRRPASSLAHVSDSLPPSAYVHTSSRTSYRRSSVLSPPSPIHAIATPRPTLLFALASDDPAEVRRVLESGEARVNDVMGPQSALAFTLGARQLKKKVEMVKLLLAHGADPGAIVEGGSKSAAEGGSESGSPSRLLEELDPASRYYVQRAAAPQTRRASALIHRSFFRPLARVRYDLIGQDRALEQLFRVLSMPSMAPIVVLLCGPSGHGKSLLARKFGSLLDVPTHTVNMTTLRSTHDIWRSYSMSPYEATSTCTLAEFLVNNEGRRCVVVLDEIEKVEDEKSLSSLLMPWELGRCSFEAGHRHVDVSQVIWLGTSNIGHELVFEHQCSRQDPEVSMSREEYVDLMALLRPRVSEKLGASLLSRVTTVLPFVPFTTDEKMAISAEALYSLAGDDAATLPPATVDMIVRNSLSAYLPAEGARSLYRAVSTLLLDNI